MKKFVFLLTGALLVFPFFTAVSLESETPVPSAPPADESSVTGALQLRNKENLISITVITKEDILDCIGCDLTDILERFGVQVRRYHSLFYRSSDTDKAYVSLRGASDTQTLLLIDGVQKEDSMLSQALWAFVPVHHIERIEIVRGPQSSRDGRGDSAMAGVVHIITEKADCLEGRFCANAKMDLSNESETGRTLSLSGQTRTSQSGFRVPGFDEQNVRDPEGKKLDWKLENSITHEIGFRVEKDPWNFFDISVFNTELKYQYVEEDYNLGNQGVVLIPTIHDDTAYMQGVEIQSRFEVGALGWQIILHSYRYR